MSTGTSVMNELFGGASEDQVHLLIDDWCRSTLGTCIRSKLFARSGVGYVTGAELIDGRRVVVKVVRDTSIGRLTAVQQIQTRLVDRGFPAPRPLAPASPLAGGLAVAEELVADIGRMPNGHNPLERAEMARQLARLVSHCTDIAPNLVTELASGYPLWTRPPRDQLWPKSHDPRVDMTATGNGTELVDQLGAQAREYLLARWDAEPWVVGHGDWEAQNMRFVSGRIAVAYDWDSLIAAPEPVIAGLAAAVFSSQPVSGAGDVPTVVEQDAFLDEYQQARGMTFDADQRRMVIAAGGWITAYNARTQYSFLRRPPDDGGGLHLDHAPQMLQRLEDALH